VLAAGGTAVEAVEASIRVLEGDETFNAGKGSACHADGSVAMDAALMDGASLDIGAVAALQGVSHPITVARLMLRESPVLLAGDGARLFAEQHGAELDPGQRPAYGLDAEPVRRDTVGCLALDQAGHLASGTSTGGLQGAPPGRVGDSPMPGAGFYADDARGAVAFSGDGEFIARLALASEVMSRLGRENPQRAVEAAVASLKRIGGEAGAIALNASGEVAFAHNAPNFAVAYVTSEMKAPQVFLRRGDENAGPHE
jgi:L-asparaginase / beta-aspartyl-peptidase